MDDEVVVGLLRSAESEQVERQDRVGPSRRLATAEEERSLSERRQAANLPYRHFEELTGRITDLVLTGATA